MKLWIKIVITGSQSAYAGVAIDEPLPADFYNYDKYLIGIMQYVPDSEPTYRIEYSKTIDFADGKHYIAVSTDKNNTVKTIMIKIYDATTNILKSALYKSGGSEYIDKQLLSCFEISGATFTRLGDYNGWYPYGEEPFTPSDGSEPSPDIGNLIEQFWPMMQNMIQMMMQMMMMMAMMQTMAHAMTSIAGAII